MQADVRVEVGGGLITASYERLIRGIGAAQDAVGALPGMPGHLAEFAREILTRMKTIPRKEQMENRGIIDPKMPNPDTPLFRDNVDPAIVTNMLRTYLYYGCTDQYKDMVAMFPNGNHPGVYVTYDNQIWEGEHIIAHKLLAQTALMYNLLVEAEDVLDEGPDGLPCGNLAVGIFANILEGKDNFINSSRWYLNEDGAEANIDTMRDVTPEVKDYFKHHKLQFLKCVAHFLGYQIKTFFKGHPTQREENLPPPVSEEKQREVWEEILLRSRAMSIDMKLNYSGVVGIEISNAPLWTDQIGKNESLQCALEFLYTVFVQERPISVEQLSCDSVWLSFDKNVNIGSNAVIDHLRSFFANNEHYVIESLLRRDNHFLAGLVKIETDGKRSYRELDFHIDKDGKISFAREI